MGQWTLYKAKMCLFSHQLLIVSFNGRMFKISKKVKAKTTLMPGPQSESWHENWSKTGYRGIKKSEMQGSKKMQNHNSHTTFICLSIHPSINTQRKKQSHICLTQQNGRIMSTTATYNHRTVLILQYVRCQTVCVYWNRIQWASLLHIISYQSRGDNTWIHHSMN